MKGMLIWLWLLSSMTLCLAQGNRDSLTVKNKPDLSGTWVLDMSKSNLGPSKHALDYDELTLIISQQEPKIRITRKLIKNKKEHSQELVYYSDARGESNPQMTGKEIVKSKTKWNGDVLISHGIHRIVLAGDVLTFETMDKWELSADGNTLIQTTASTPPRSVFGRPVIMLADIQDIKRIFRRVP